jgi:hypothetical protein
MWLGIDELEVDVVVFDTSFRRAVEAGFPTFNLQQVDVTPRYYRTGTDAGDTFRTAAFNARFYWLIPEPATWIFVVMGVSLIQLCRRSYPQ